MRSRVRLLPKKVCPLPARSGSLRTIATGCLEFRIL